MRTSTNKNRNREAQFAGQFYPDDKLELQMLLKEYFAGAIDYGEKEDKNELPRALITPHAGYVFCGKVAASAYLTLSKNSEFKNVFILASSHRYSFDGAAVYKVGNYETPLGEVMVNTTIANQLLEKSHLFLEHNDSHIDEHSLEVQLPFLQHQLDNNFTLVPLILGTRNPDSCREIANVLKEWFTTENLFVISTDFSHYPDHENAEQVDKTTCNAICKNNPDQLLEVLNDNKKLDVPNLVTLLCGWTSVLTLLYLTTGKSLSFKKVRYLNSGDARQYNNKKRVVGYWAITIHDNNEFRITENEKAELLEKARTSIERFVNTGKRNALIPPLTKGMLLEKTGAFVSVYIGGKLRGCIGNFAQDKTLNEMIQNVAASASCDHRFERVQKNELQDLELEISVLSPLKKINSVNEIVLGKHGIYIRSGLNSGTFLPQVATKTGWNLEQFLGYCSRDKAGLEWDSWKTAELFTYEAIIFRS